MQKKVLIFIALTLTASVSCSAEEKLNNSLILKLMSQLPKNVSTQFQSTLKNKLDGQHISPACLTRFLKLTMTDIDQVFQGNFSSFLFAQKYVNSVEVFQILAI